MSNHTPGPWRLNGYQVERGEGIARTIATVAPRRQIGTDYAASDADTAMANARLIAAAPDLLDMCERLLGFAWHYGSTSGVAAGEEMLAKAKALIAQAKGGAV